MCLLRLYSIIFVMSGKLAIPEMRVTTKAAYFIMTLFAKRSLQKSEQKVGVHKLLGASNCRKITFKIGDVVY